ncbi:hypothetical protein ACFVQ4_29630 [Streptomyces laurentii]|uniref:hypothetical protein n=1 Tax=Streptomyces laurentii TaxID=39478 RepID=UPI003678DB5F
MSGSGRCFEERSQAAGMGRATSAGRRIDPSCRDISDHVAQARLRQFSRDICPLKDRSHF